MTDYRSSTEFTQALAEDYAWRYKEMVDQKAAIDRAKGVARGQQLRFGVVMIYAHWEGHIKFAASQFLRYVADAIALRQIERDAVHPRVLTLAVWSRGIGNAGASLATFVPQVEPMLPFFAAPAAIELNSIIDTESNLSSRVFRRIVTILGIDYAKFELHEKFIDDDLLRVRHKVAHGEHYLVNFDEYVALKDTTIMLMTMFKNEIENQVELDSFLI